MGSVWSFSSAGVWASQTVRIRTGRQAGTGSLHPSQPPAGMDLAKGGAEVMSLTSPGDGTREEVALAVGWSCLRGKLAHLPSY